MKHFTGVFKATIANVEKMMLPSMSSGSKIEFDSPEGLNNYLWQHANTEVTVTIKPVTKSSLKEHMYAYYHKAVLGCCIMALTNEGWDGIDDVAADEFLKQQVAQKLAYNKKGDVVLKYSEDKRAMGKERLHKYISDCIMFLENTFNMQVPDSEEYKHGFTKTK